MSFSIFTLFTEFYFLYIFNNLSPVGFTSVCNKPGFEHGEAGSRQTSSRTDVAWKVKSLKNIVKKLFQKRDEEQMDSFEMNVHFVC